MYKKIVMLLLGLILPSLCLAQGGFFRNRGGNSQFQQLAEDVTVLQQFDTLALTNAQITAALALYKQYPPEVPAEFKPLTDKLTAMRTRLLTGTPLPAGDVQGLFDQYRQVMQQTRGGGGGQNRQPQDAQAVKLSPLGEALWELLTQTQKAALLGDVRQAAMNNQKADRASAEQAIRQIGKLRGGDDVTWAATKDALAKALSSAAGAPDSPARKNSCAMLQDFLGRVRQMSETDFANKQDELVTELTVLMPPGASITVAMATLQPRAIQDALSGGFLSPRAAALLQELQAARVKTGQ